MKLLTPSEIRSELARLGAWSASHKLGQLSAGISRVTKIRQRVRSGPQRQFIRRAVVLDLIDKLCSGVQALNRLLMRPELAILSAIRTFLKKVW